jgi:hypothetical protein
MVRIRFPPAASLVRNWLSETNPIDDPRGANPSATFEGCEIRVGTLVKHIGPIDHRTFDPGISEVDCARTLGKLAPPKIEQCTRFRLVADPVNEGDVRSKGPTCEPSSTSLLVSSAAIICPVSASTLHPGSITPSSTASGPGLRPARRDWHSRDAGPGYRCPSLLGRLFGR